MIADFFGFIIGSGFLLLLIAPIILTIFILNKVK